MKKFISLILVAIMVVSMIPFVAAVETTPDYTYKFTKDSHGITSSGTYSIVNGNTDNSASFNVTETEDGDSWNFVYADAAWRKVVMDGRRMQWAFELYLDKQGNIVSPFLEYNPDKGLLSPSLTLEIEIDKPGVYMPNFCLVEKTVYGPKLELYLIKKPGNPEEWKSNYEENLLNLSTADRFATISSYQNSYEEYPDVISPVNITEQGRYYLIVIANGGVPKFFDERISKVDNTTYWKTWDEGKYFTCDIRPASFTLTSTTADAAKDAILNENGDAATPTVAGTATTNITVKQMKAVLGGTASTTVENVALTDGYATVTADAKDGEGNSFLYWVKGLSTGEGKKIILPDNESSNLYSATFKPETGNNYIIAVYGDGATAEKKYYNANGQLLPDGTAPTMPGYTFKEWVNCGNGMMVADYTEDTATYTITVKHQDGDKAAVTKNTITGKKYGDLVTVEAPRRYDDGTGTVRTADYYDYDAFNYWKKDDEIVSFDRSYSFYAYEDCDLTAVYKAYEPISKALRKIILTKTDNNNIMAEFIGLSDAVEKGIIFGGSTLSDSGIIKSAMTTGSSQYVVENDKNYTAYIGYAILSNGSVIYDK